MTSPHTDLDLTDAVEAAAAAQWTQRVPSIPWEKVVATNPALAHGLREQVLPIVTAAAPIIAADLTRAHAESNERALPSVEDVARALWELSEQEADTTGGAIDVPWSALDSLTQGLYRADAEDLLALIPVRAEAEVKAEAMREAILTEDDLWALLAVAGEGAEPVVVREGSRVWVLTECQDGEWWAWSWREEGEDGKPVPVEALRLPLTVLYRAAARPSGREGS